MASPLPLEGDGWIENLFYFLWCKDDFGAGPRIFIPHTVVYRATQPSAWYFTSLRTGKIKKKSTVNVNNVQIEHSFTRNKSSTDIVAYYMYLQPSAASSPASSCDDSPRGQAIIEYFDAEMLRTFLYKREKTHNGMLQKYILPKGTGSATIRAIWSPKICLLERRVNLKNLYDKRYGVYDRGVTFDGPDLYSRSEPVRGAMLPGEVQSLCETIVDHVTQVSYHKYRISRMVLHLRSDADDRLWLLWCSSLRLVQLNASEAMPKMRPLDIVSDAQVPAFVQFGLQPQPSMLLQHEQSEMASTVIVPTASQCLSCGMHMDRNRLLQTTYKAIVEHFTRFIKFLRSTSAAQSDQQAIEWPPDPRFVAAAGGVGFGIIPFMEGYNSKAKKPSPVKGSVPPDHHTISHRELVIPPVIQHLHPTFSVDDFERHRSDPIFLHKPVPVCEDCCLVYADYSTTALEVNSIRQSGPAILRPHGERSDTKKRLDSLDPFTLALSQSSPNLVPASLQTRTIKPPASAWKPIPASKGVTSKYKRDDPKKPQSTLSTLPTAPQMPQRIDSFESVQGASFDNGSNNGDQLRQREEAFFRELYSQKDLEKGHPLHHMLNPKLGAKAVSIHGSGVAKSQSMGALPDILTKTTGKSPYSIVQRLRNAADGDTGAVIDTKEIAKPISTKKAQLQAKKSKSSSTTAKDQQKSRFVSQREKQASAEHQEFLFAALSGAQAQVHCLSLAIVYRYFILTRVWWH